MHMKLIRLSRPNPNNLYSTYENQLEPRYYFLSTDLKTLFDNHEDYILQTTEGEIRNYVDDDDLCNDSDGMFPKRSMLTGEWYIRSVSFEDDILLIETALIGTDLGYKDDYLGLEVVFLYDEERNVFSFNGINSSAL